MPRKWVEPREIKKRGETRWCVTTPKEMTGGRQKRRFFRDELSAQLYADDLNDNRAGAAKWFLMLPADVQSAIHTAVEMLNGEAKELPAAVQQYLAGKIVETKTVSQAVAACLTARTEMNVRGAYGKSLKSSLTRFAKNFGERSIHSITVEDVETWLRTRVVSVGRNKGKPIAPITRRGLITDLRTLFNFAIGRHYCKTNPANAIARPSTDDMPRATFTVDQCKAILEWIRKNDLGLLRPTCATLFGGLRPDESAWLKPEAFKQHQIIIEGAEAKGRKRRVVEINATLAAWLKVAPAMSLTNLDKRMKRLRKAFSPWPHDGLKHSFVSYRAPIVGIAKTAIEAGESEDTIIRHYLALKTEAEAQEFWALRP